MEVGRLLKPHGLAGEMVVQLVTDRTERVAKGSVLHHEGGTLKVTSSRPHQGKFLVRFEGVSTREQCDALRGRVLSAPPLDDADGFWVHELVGSMVVSSDGVERGVVESVQSNPANDLLVLKGGALVPVTFIVDGPSEGRVTVEVPDGLFDLYA